MYFISAPFGNYLQYTNFLSDTNTTCVTGTFTLKPRAGRISQILKTLRYVNTEAGWSWRNQLGLRNPGIFKALAKHKWYNVMSIASLEREDWYKLYAQVPTKQNVEINISCPNVQHNPDVLFGLDLWPRTKRRWCIIKVPPTVEHKTIDILVNNAGMQHRAPLEDFPVDMFESLMRTNVYSVFNVGKVVAKNMLSSGHGKIINIASVQASSCRSPRCE